MLSFNHNSHVHYYQTVGLTHFSEIATVTPIIASEIVRDTGAAPHFSFTNSSAKIEPMTQAGN